MLRSGDRRSIADHPIIRSPIQKYFFAPTVNAQNDPLTPGVAGGGGISWTLWNPVSGVTVASGVKKYSTPAPASQPLFVLEPWSSDTVACGSAPSGNRAGSVKL